MTDRYEMTHPSADACQHAGVGKACRQCRETFESMSHVNLYHHPEVQNLMYEAVEHFRRSIQNDPDSLDDMPNPYKLTTKTNYR